MRARPAYSGIPCQVENETLTSVCSQAGDISEKFRGVQNLEVKRDQLKLPPHCGQQLRQPPLQASQAKAEQQRVLVEGMTQHTNCNQAVLAINDCLADWQLKVTYISNLVAESEFLM